MSTNLADPAPGSSLRRTRAGRYQTIEAKARCENDPTAPKPRLPDRAAGSATTQSSTGEVIFDPGGIRIHRAERNCERILTQRRREKDHTFKTEEYGTRAV